MIEHTTLSQIVASSAIYYDPDPKDSIIKSDEDLLRFHFETELDEIDTSNLSPWLIRFEVDKEKMLARSINIE
jgi:DNA-directed RNA polymerase II subunit RPB1